MHSKKGMLFNTIQIQQFVRVAELESVSGAAKELNISQSALSRSLRRFEQELGCELFVRSSNTLAPNAQAKAILPTAYELLRAEQHFKEQLSLTQLR